MEVIKSEFRLPKMKYDIATRDDHPKYMERMSEIVKDFHVLYYYYPHASVVSWRGKTINKCPFDLWNIAEVVWQKKPDYFIECGTSYGGFSLFVADIFNIIGKGMVITVDVQKAVKVNIDHPRIKKIVGDSVSPAVLKKIKKFANSDGSVMVDLDSDHSTDHVLAELEAYGPMVTPDHYMICEDTNLPPTMNALQTFMERHPRDWVADHALETRHLLTFNPGGYLVKVKK